MSLLCDSCKFSVTHGCVQTDCSLNKLPSKLNDKTLVSDDNNNYYYKLTNNCNYYRNAEWYSNNKLTNLKTALNVIQHENQIAYKVLITEGDDIDIYKILDSISLLKIKPMTIYLHLHNNTKYCVDKLSSMLDKIKIKWHILHVIELSFKTLYGTISYIKRTTKHSSKYCLMLIRSNYDLTSRTISNFNNEIFDNNLRFSYAYTKNNEVLILPMLLVNWHMFEHKYKFLDTLMETECQQKYLLKK